MTLPVQMRLPIRELDYIARAADLAGFPAVSMSADARFDDDAVLDGLVARGLIADTDGEPVLRDDLATLLGAVLACEMSLDIRTSDASGESAVVLHLANEVAIAQRVDGADVAFYVLLPDRLPAALLSLCGQAPTPDGEMNDDGTVRVTAAALEAVERGDREVPELHGYVTSANAPDRTGVAMVRGTLYGEPRASCAWVSGAGGTYVVRHVGADAEVVRADGWGLVWYLLRLVGPPAGAAGAAAGR